MKNTNTILLIIFSTCNLIFLSCGKQKNDSHVFTEKETIETQKHINRFFHKEIIPRIQTAWSQLSDSSKAITYEYNYVKNGDRWIFKDLRKNESSLSPKDDSMALSIMVNAVKGSFFPQMEDQKQDSTLTLYWSWPVPFPEGTFDDASGEFIAKQNTGGGSTGGCDGHGTKAKCFTCVKQSCETVCVGYQTCVTDANSCTSTKRCASGGPFGISGGFVIQ